MSTDAEIVDRVKQVAADAIMDAFRALEAGHTNNDAVFERIDKWLRVCQAAEFAKRSATWTSGSNDPLPVYSTD